MNIKHAQYMLTILQEGGITNAARKLYVSQPSLSQMVKLVENNLGAPIFNRTKDPLTLTYAGQRYMEAARQVLAINENLKKEIEEINHEDHGKFSSGNPCPAWHADSPSCASRIFEKYPHVDIELTEYGSTETEKLLLDGKVDIVHVSAATFHDTNTAARMFPTVFYPRGCNVENAAKNQSRFEAFSSLGGGWTERPCPYGTDSA